MFTYYSNSGVVMFLLIFAYTVTICCHKFCLLIFFLIFLFKLPSHYLTFSRVINCTKVATTAFRLVIFALAIMEFLRFINFFFLPFFNFGHVYEYTYKTKKKLYILERWKFVTPQVYCPYAYVLVSGLVLGFVMYYIYYLGIVWSEVSLHDNALFKVFPSPFPHFKKTKKSKKFI